MSCDDCLTVVVSECEGAPWGATVVPRWLCMASPPSQAYTPAGSREHPGDPTKAGGRRSEVRDTTQTPAQQCSSAVLGARLWQAVLVWVCHCPHQLRLTCRVEELRQLI